MRREKRMQRLWVGGCSAAAFAVALTLALSAPAHAAGLCEAYRGVPTFEPTQHPGMVRIGGGTFTMGEDDGRPEERSERQVTVSPFWIDRHEVTNAQFARFVAATGYRTQAETGLDPKLYPDLSPDMLAPGSMVFKPPRNPVDLNDPLHWWRYQQGANWRQPLGPGSTIDGLNNHPVVHVSWLDARAYARWLGRDLPTEAEWEFAARGGLHQAHYTWGETYDPLDGWKANVWQGNFPDANSAADGYARTAPVGCFPANGFGLFDMGGNVWEYAKDLWMPLHPEGRAVDPTGPDLRVALKAAGPAGPAMVVKGGSYLCTPQFCLRYRPAARQPQEVGLGASHIGFRTVIRAD
jgi:sulfatase modifying factor 1